jgi:hypothetical protein
MVLQEENVTSVTDAKWAKLNLQAPYTYNEAITSKVWTQALMVTKFRRPKMDERSTTVHSLLSIVQVLNKVDSMFSSLNSNLVIVLQCFHDGEQILSNNDGEQEEWRVCSAANGIVQYNIRRWSHLNASEKHVCERALYQTRRIAMCEMFHLQQSDLVLEFKMRGVPLKDDKLINAKTMLMSMLAIWIDMSDTHKSSKKFSQEFCSAMDLRNVLEGKGVVWRTDIQNRMEIIQATYTTTTGKPMDAIKLITQAVQYYVDIEEEKEKARQTATSLRMILKDEDEDDCNEMMDEDEDDFNDMIEGETVENGDHVEVDGWRREDE